MQKKNSLVFVLSVLATLSLVSCASTPNPASVAPKFSPQKFSPQKTAMNDMCLDPGRPMRDFSVVSPREVIVTYSKNKTYRVTTKDNCPAFQGKDLDNIRSIGFSDGPAKYIGYRQGYGPMYASPVPLGRVCGRFSERVVVRDRFETWASPTQSCLIEKVERLP